MKLLILFLLALTPTSQARLWSIKGVPKPIELEYIMAENNYVLVKDSKGTTFELPFAKFSTADKRFIALLYKNTAKTPVASTKSKPLARAKDYKIITTKSLNGKFITLRPASELHLTGGDDPLAGSSVHFTAPDGWLFFDNLKPSVVDERFLNRMLVNGSHAEIGKNIRVEPYGSGTVLIPHSPDFTALTLYKGQQLGGTSQNFKAYDKAPITIGDKASSLLLKRGYMVTLAQEKNGSGFSKCYVAQDHDLIIKKLPKGLNDQVAFIRIFPWRATSKKGIAGNIHANLDLGWFYNWNISSGNDIDLEYVPIKQKRHWPGLDLDWKALGATHLLGFNEPDRPDQANMTVDEAIQGWPELLSTGLRLGSPSVSDGGLSWLYDFMKKADRAKLRVDFINVHYYRAVGDPGDGRAAASQLYKFLKDIHDRTKRPIWITEWNNGANWTNGRDPKPSEQRRAIKAMIEMLDETPFVERYALYNWVEESRELVRKDNSLTPAGEAYLNQKSPPAYRQEKP